jgi:hypothetical protein
MIERTLLVGDYGGGARSLFGKRIAIRSCRGGNVVVKRQTRKK